jgi:hypothetical protein
MHKTDLLDQERCQKIRKSIPWGPLLLIAFAVLWGAPMLTFSFSAPFNRRPENVVVKAVIIAELELSHIEVKIFFAHVVERADDTALEDAPKTLNRLGMDRANNILMLGVVNGSRAGM